MTSRSIAGPENPLSTRRGWSVGAIESRYASTILLPEGAARVVLHGRWQTIASADGRTLLSYGDPLSRPVPNEYALALHRDGALVYTLEQPWTTGSQFDLSEAGDAALIGSADGTEWEARHVGRDGRVTFRHELPGPEAYRSVAVLPETILAHRIDPSGHMEHGSVVLLDKAGARELCVTSGPCELISLGGAFLIRYGDRVELHELPSGRRVWSSPGRAAGSGPRSWCVMPDAGLVGALTRPQLRAGQPVPPHELVLFDLASGRRVSSTEIPGTESIDPRAHMIASGNELRILSNRKEEVYRWYR